MRIKFLMLWALTAAPAVPAEEYNLLRPDFCAGGGAVKNNNHTLVSSVGLGNFGHMCNDFFYIGPATRIVQLADAQVPSAFQLLQNYPNPFNAGTTFQYDVPRPSKVNIEIYSVLGRRIAVLYSGFQIAGRYRLVYGGLDAHQVPLPSGLYFCKMAAGGAVHTVKFVIMR